MSATQRRIGRVKWFNDAKGFGFIYGNHQGDIFVHYSDILGHGYRTLRDGDWVEFDLVETPKGLRARNVVVVQEPAQGQGT